MCRLLFFLVFTVGPLMAMGQSTESASKWDRDTTAYMVVETQPQFPGGVDALRDYLRTSVRYPATAPNEKARDRVLVRVTVEKDGTLSSIRLHYGRRDDFINEALRVVRLMPRWQPGAQDGHPLRVNVVIPVEFCPDGCAFTIRR
ncbi:TonB family protein [Fibrisoma montanum]|uniref:TonB family protein n=1 Tax=Fibrisoma montanum TaxID=2305895 RepID=A0A418LY04_9BACT|nr:TonB family protein [Fibrisoma montanum]RIV18115.1 TonB family protein [Fibrisoma montanum]